MASPLGIFLVETDRTLVDSHFILASRGPAGSLLCSAIMSCVHSLEPVYVAFRKLRTTNLGNAAPSLAILVKDEFRHFPFVTNCQQAKRQAEDERQRGPEFVVQFQAERGGVKQPGDDGNAGVKLGAK